MSPIINPSGGGGSQSDPATLGWMYFGSLAGGNVADTVADQTWTSLTWGVSTFDSSGAGPNPFTLTDPTFPVIVKSGIYAISAETAVLAAHAGKQLRCILFFDSDGVDDGPGADQMMDGPNTKINVSATRYLTAGMKVDLEAWHNVGAPTAVAAWMLVQRLA